MTTDLVPYEAFTMPGDELLVRFLEEGAPLSMAERASGVPASILARLPLTRPPRPPSSEELGAKAARLAAKAIDTLMDDLERGGPAVRLRAATAVVGHPLRRMAPDSSAEIAELKGMFEQVLRGEMPDEMVVQEGS